MKIPQTKSHTSNVVWVVADEFCPRLIVVDGIIISVSTVVHRSFSVTKLWLPSSTKFINSDQIYQREALKSVVFENVAILKSIGVKSFSGTSLKFFIVPASVEMLNDGCFMQCKSLSSVTFESG
jgi:hypothetical protein